MANERESGVRFEKATVDTAPAVGGYATNPVNPEQKNVDRLFFSVLETGDSSTFTATVTLQWRALGEADWQDYETYTTVTRKLIEGKSKGVQWRAMVDNGDYTDGTVTFGFDW